MAAAEVSGRGRRFSPYTCTMRFGPTFSAHPDDIVGFGVATLKSKKQELV